MLKVLLSLFFSLSLFAKSNHWYSRVDAKVEMGMYLPLVGGNIENLQNHPPADFSKDFAYTDAKASYFSLELRHDYDYAPNLYFSYFNMQDNQSATLTKTVQVAGENFDSNISTSINYQVCDATIYQDLRMKGHVFSVFGKKYYSGDLEFDVGLSTKLFQWQYEVKDLTNLSRASSWIHVNEFIPLPYIGMKYFLYDLLIYANASDLAFSKAKSSDYQAGIDYRVVSGLYLSASYIYEQFKVVEKEDTVDFETSGYKLSFKYAF